MNAKDVRWRQRLNNFGKAVEALEKVAHVAEPSDIERAALIQFFETAFELSWKTLKDYLEAEGLETKTPRVVIKEAFRVGLIVDGEMWLNMLEDRNLTAHTYDESMSKQVATIIQSRYAPLLVAVLQRLQSDAAEDEVGR